MEYSKHIISGLSGIATAEIAGRVLEKHSFKTQSFAVIGAFIAGVSISEFAYDIDHHNSKKYVSKIEEERLKENIYQYRQ